MDNIAIVLNFNIKIKTHFKKYSKLTSKNSSRIIPTDQTSVLGLDVDTSDTS